MRSRAGAAILSAFGHEVLDQRHGRLQPVRGFEVARVIGRRRHHGGGSQPQVFKPDSKYQKVEGVDPLRETSDPSGSTV